jgi:hypothetical protein
MGRESADRRFRVGVDGCQGSGLPFHVFEQVFERVLRGPDSRLVLGHHLGRRAASTPARQPRLGSGGCVAHRYRYRTEPVEVVEVAEVAAEGRGAPAEFRWRGRRYVVHDVLASWVEAVPWWRGVLLATGASGQSYVWRVEAAGRADGAQVPGVYELRRDPPRGGSDRGDGHWSLVRVLD